MPSGISLDAGIIARLNRLAEARSSSPDAVVCDAMDALEDKDRRGVASGEGEHPSGKPWPKRNPVGGIITPV